MGKAKQRRRLLRVVIASGLLVVAVPSVATAHEHLTPVDALDRGRQAGVDTAWANLVEPLSLRADFYSQLYKECSVDPRHAALKHVLGLRDVPVREDVRRPLRQLTDGEREELRGWLASS